MSCLISCADLGTFGTFTRTWPNNTLKLSKYILCPVIIQPTCSSVIYSKICWALEKINPSEKNSTQPNDSVSIESLSNGMADSPYVITSSSFAGALLVDAQKLPSASITPVSGDAVVLQLGTSKLPVWMDRTRWVGGD